MTDWSRVKSPLDMQKESFDNFCEESMRKIYEHPEYQRALKIRDDIRFVNAKDVTPTCTQHD